MADVVFVAILVAFFAVCILFVGACDRIIGAEEASPTEVTAGDEGPGPEEELVA